jgi:hypothetical protein
MGGTVIWENPRWAQPKQQTQNTGESA